MNSKNTRRGFDKDDERWFSKESMLKLHKAQEELIWLMDRGYKIDKVMELVGGRYQFSVRQRAALIRSTCSTKQCKKRQSTLLNWAEAKDGGIYIDGLNLIITLEVALSKSSLILGNDGVIRDLAGLRGSYRIIDKTYKAVELIGKTLQELKVLYVKFFLDAPVSNSGRLKSLILEHSQDWNLPVEVELVRNPDVILKEMERIVTGDAVILDSCKSWFNLSGKIIDQYIRESVIVNLSCDSNAIIK